MSFGGGGGGGTTTTNTVTQPWSGQQSYLSQQYANAAKLYNNQADYPQLYPGATGGSEITPFNSTETQSLSNIANLGMGGNSATNSDQNFQNYALNGGLLSNTNPYFSNEAQQISSQVQPQLMSSFNAGNDMNNPGAAYAVSNGLSAALGNLAGQNYENALTTTGQIANFGAPNLYNTQLGGQQAAEASGATTQNQLQSVLNSQIGAYNYQQTLPYNMLNTFTNEISGNPGSASAITQPYYNNNASNILGLGTQGLGAYLGSSGGGGASGAAAAASAAGKGGGDAAAADATAADAFALA